MGVETEDQKVPDQQMAIDFDSSEHYIHWLAEELVGNDDGLLQELIEARRRSNLTVEQVALRMGVAPETVGEFEAYYADPPLSLIRRYALAIDYHVDHVAKPAAEAWIELGRSERTAAAARAKLDEKESLRAEVELH